MLFFNKEKKQLYIIFYVDVGSIIINKHLLIRSIQQYYLDHFIPS